MNPSVNMLRKLPIGIQSFEKLRSEGFLYVDKTALVFRLVQAGAPCNRVHIVTFLAIHCPAYL